ncbi:MAG: xanthine dehydrogenase family protein molybdopterin-binding subunit, partial [Planctomycetota bacterium]
TGRPVKLMLDRDQELKLGGNRPSAYLKVKLGADADGVIKVWDSEHWTTGGAVGGGVTHNGVIPYVFEPKNYRRSQINIKTNLGPQRAWRAPNHPQACAITQTALDDLAARMGADSMDIFLRNLGTDDARRIGGAKPSVYRAEIELAAKLMDWKAKWHPHGKGAAKGSVVDGLGLAIHTWGGGANDSNCNLKIYPDGSVETFCGTQDLGVGTRTAIAIVLGETLGIPYAGIKVNIGSSKLPVSGPSGGSTTIGGVSESHRRAATDALARIKDLVAKKLEVAASTLVAANGRIGVKGQTDKSLSWKEACNLIGMRPLEVTGSYKRGTPSPLSNSTVGGVQMAHVLVDKDTGVVKINKFVAVQDGSPRATALRTPPPSCAREEAGCAAAPDDVLKWEVGRCWVFDPSPPTPFPWEGRGWNSGSVRGVYGPIGIGRTPRGVFQWHDQPSAADWEEE